MNEGCELSLIFRVWKSHMQHEGNHFCTKKAFLKLCFILKRRWEDEKLGHIESQKGKSFQDGHTHYLNLIQTSL